LILPLIVDIPNPSICTTGLYHLFDEKGGIFLTVSA
jgi:hypothetical protein